MRSIVDNNREVLLDPIGTRVVRSVFSTFAIVGELTFCGSGAAGLSNNTTAPVLYAQLLPMSCLFVIPRQAMGALGTDLFTYGKIYWLVPFAIFIGLFMPVPFWLVHRFCKKESFIAKAAAYVNTPILLLYTGYLPYSVNGRWW